MGLTQEEFDYEANLAFDYLENRNGLRANFEEALEEVSEQYEGALKNLATK
jgi:hypothetical protein